MVVANQTRIQRMLVDDIPPQQLLQLKILDVDIQPKLMLKNLLARFADRQMHLEIATQQHFQQSLAVDDSAGARDGQHDGVLFHLVPTYKVAMPKVNG